MIPSGLGCRGVTGRVVWLLAAVLVFGGCTRGVVIGGKTVIASSPDNGAEVTVDGESQGPTPVTLEGLPPGKVLIVLRKDGFKRTTKMVTIVAGLDQRLVIEMEPMLGYISVDSKPPGAKVYLDQFEYLGETPIVHKAVPIGKHTYDLRKENFKTEESSIDVEEDFSYTYMHELTPRNARLSIFSRPTNAKIWINEELQPDSTPAKIELIPGEYTVKLYTTGYLTYEENIQLGPNEDRSLEAVLQPGNAPMGMILIPAGPFIMGNKGGAPDERPQREVTVAAFYIDKYEVTNAQFRAVFPEYRFPKAQANYPATGVSFKQATDFAQAVGKRLPTEVEWEKAARGADGREYPWGQEFNKDLCNTVMTEADRPVRIGSYRLGASPYGCMDMAGNVFEWTSSWYQAYPGNTDVTKDYGQVFRVLRGGSFKSDRFGVRCARRHYDRMDVGKDDYGFRCAKDVGAAP